MASSSTSNVMQNPLRLLLGLYESDANIDVDSFPARVASHFGEIFASHDAFNEIPVLDWLRPPKYHADRSLVRFRAMIQDTSPSSEIYLARRRNGHTSGWGLFADTLDGRDDAEMDYDDLRECSVLWAVSIPGESEWCVDDLPGDHGSKPYEPHQEARPHKYPAANGKHIGVQVKVYENARAALMKSTEMHNFVGVLTHEPLHSDVNEEPGIQVPTLHVLFSRPVPRTIVPRSFPLQITADIRKELIAWISGEALAGDTLAAEWTFLCALARVQSRTPPILPPSLTLAKFPSHGDRQPILPMVISRIFPTVTHIPLSLSTINTTLFFPESKDEDLHSGWLQVPPGSVVVISEGGIREGGVNEKGIMNIRAIQELMNDAACITVCEGKKSVFFQTNVTVPLQPQCPEAEVIQHLYKSEGEIKMPPKERLDAFRALVGGAKVGSVTVGEDVAKYIQDDFVKERQQSSSQAGKMTSENLILRMTIARLLALSHHSQEVTVAIWEDTKKLEAAKNARLASL
ncbi:Mini-chromosome maintenance complex-binding protein [Pleurotus pulmonarius]